MNEEIKPDNKGEEEVNNTTENLPTEESKVETKPEETKEEVDPEMAKWMEDTGSMENAYKRVQGGAEEVEKFKKEAEDIKKERVDYEAQVAAELQQVYQKDPELAAKLFGMEQPKSDTTEQQTIDPKEIATQASNEAVARIQVDNFYENNKSHFKTEQDWENTQAIALSFVGKTDREGNPYTIQTALRDATLLGNSELIGDKAISEHLTSEANRASASESGDTPSGESSEDGKLDQDVEKHMEDLAPELGIELTPEMKERIANRLGE